jgi:adenylate cyclase
MAEDEAATVRALTDNREAISMLVGQHRGRVVDSPGDNLLAEFPTATDAVSCAVEIQGVLKARNAQLPVDRKMQFRIGVHSGEVRAEGERLYGDGVNIAARLEGLADPAGICISDMVYKQVHAKLNLGFEDLGDQEVKNIPEPVRAYRVRPEAVPVTTEAESRPPRRVAPFVAVVVAVGALAVALWGVYLRPGPPVEEPVPTEAAALELPDKPSIAVLPFANMSDDPEQEYFSDGISEDLITDLSRISGLLVISRNSSFAYKGRSVNLPQVGRELGVRYVVEGSVRKAGDSVRITAQLVDTTTDHHLWADRYDRKLEDIFALQDEVTGKIVDALEVSLTERERAGVEQVPTDNLMAYDYFLRGITYFGRFTKESNRQAREIYERAIELDPDFALAHATLAWTHLIDWMVQWSDDPNTPERAFELAQRALALDDSVGSAHSVLAYQRAYKGHYQEAVAEAEKAILLNPSDANGLFHLAIMLINAGRSEEAVPLLKKAIRLNPVASFMYLSPLGESYRRLGRHEEAIDTLKRALIGNPDTLYAHLFLAGIYADIGERELARREASEVLRISPRFSLQAMSRTLVSDRDAGLTAALRKAGLPE